MRPSFGIRSASSSRALAVLLAVTFLAGIAAVPAAAEDDLVRRWDLDEKPFAERSFPRKVVSNVRDGAVNLVDSLAQGVLSIVSLANPRSGGLLFQKVATLGGDIVGLVDNNVATQHLTKGIVSRQLLRFGAGAARVPHGIAFIHDTEFDVETLTAEDFVGDSMFHAQAYIQPSVLATICAIVVSDVIVRPIGSLLTIFGARGTGERMDEWGKGLIEKSFRARFL